MEKEPQVLSFQGVLALLLELEQAQEGCISLALHAEEDGIAHPHRQVQQQE